MKLILDANSYGDLSHRCHNIVCPHQHTCIGQKWSRNGTRPTVNARKYKNEALKLKSKNRNLNNKTVVAVVNTVLCVNTSSCGTSRPLGYQYAMNFNEKKLKRFLRNFTYRNKKVSFAAVTTYHAIPLDLLNVQITDVSLISFD